MNSPKKGCVIKEAVVCQSLKNIESYYGSMFFSTVCSSFKGFKCMIKKLEDPTK